MSCGTPLRAGDRPSGPAAGAAKATEELITDPDRGQPGGNSVQLTEDT